MNLYQMCIKLDRHHTSKACYFFKAPLLVLHSDVSLLVCSSLVLRMRLSLSLGNTAYCRYVAAAASEVVATESDARADADAGTSAAGESDGVDTGSGPSAASGPILVLGATGNIGGRVANQVADDLT